MFESDNRCRTVHDLPKTPGRSVRKPYVRRPVGDYPKCERDGEILFLVGRQWLNDKSLCYAHDTRSRGTAKPSSFPAVVSVCARKTPTDRLPPRLRAGIEKEKAIRVKIKEEKSKRRDRNDVLLEEILLRSVCRRRDSG